MHVTKMNAAGSQPSGCPICGDAEQLYRFTATNPRFAVFECSRCGLGRTWPPVAGDQIGSFYPPEYYGRNNVRFNLPFEYLIRVFRRRRARVIRRRTAPGKSLDVGCGRGMMLDNFRRFGYKPTGIEISDHAARHAREMLGLDVKIVPLSEANLSVGKFCVVIFDHFSFEQNPYGWIQSILNSLRFKTNLLYSILKHEAARHVQLSKHPIQVAANILLLPILLPASIALTVFDAAIRSGGTIEIYAVKESSPE